MEAEIKAIIEKSLPAQVGEVLKKRLQQAEQDAISVKDLQEQTIILKKHCTDYVNEINQYKKLDERNAAIEARERAVIEGERNLQISHLQFQLSAEKSKAEFSRDLAMGLVRNVEYRNSIYSNENQSGFNDSNGRWITPGPIQKSINEDKSAH